MKKYLLLLLALAVTRVMSVAAPLNLVFETLTGEQKAFEAKSLVMTVSGDKLQVTNATGSEELDLSKLSKMYFSTGQTGVEGTVTDIASGRVEVFTAAGVSVGNFNSVADAMHQLPAGIYVINNGTTSFKIAVK